MFVCLMFLKSFYLCSSVLKHIFLFLKEYFNNILKQTNKRPTTKSGYKTVRKLITLTIAYLLGKYFIKK